MRRLILVLAALPLAAPTAAQSVADDPYEALVAQLVTPEALDIAFRRMMEVELPAAFLSDPEIAALEGECPGAVEAVLAVAGPHFLELNEERELEYLAAMRDLVAARMSAADARAATEFFASGIGRSFLRTISGQGKIANSFRSAITDDDLQVDRDAFDRDRQASAAAGIAALSDTERRAFNATRDTSWGRTLASLAPEAAELRLRAMNKAYTPEQDAALERLASGALLAHFTACDEADGAGN